MKPHKFYKIIFVSHDQLYEIYARQVYQADLMGFIAVEGLCFSKKDSIVIDPSEESLRNQFADVNRFFIPIHSVVRIEEVTHLGQPKIHDTGDNIAQFPTGAYQEKYKPSKK